MKCVRCNRNMVFVRRFTKDNKVYKLYECKRCGDMKYEIDKRGGCRG